MTRFVRLLLLFPVILFFCAGRLSAQTPESAVPTMEALAPATPASARLDGLARRRALREGSLVANLAFRGIGPSVMSGRIVDVDADPADPTHFYAAYASGGLWKTTNNGQSFTSLFDEEAVMTLGDVAVDWTHGETVWAGTGENNSSRSSYAGAGIYRSTDGGQTWQHLGLAETHRIGRIVLHPDDPNTVWVAALGHLYSPNPERGVFKTDDGGVTWRKTLFVDEHTGAVDLVVDPGNPDVLFAAMWHRERAAWNFVESGTGSGIYKSTDGGETWTRLTTDGSGFPTGDGVGRIGLALYDANTLYAVLDNYDRRPPEEEEEKPGLTRDALRTMSRADFLKLDDGDVEAYLRDNGFPEKYTAAAVKAMVREEKIRPVALVEYVEDANQQLFDTPVIGAEVYRSDDGGHSWHRTHAEYLDNVYFSYGYYFGQIRVAHDTPDRVYIMGVPILKSDDGGQTWQNIGRENVHGDHHALWLDPHHPGHLINGNDGGLNISYDDGATWFKANAPTVGQFYAIAVDDAKPYNVYGGLQDNGVWFGPSTNTESLRWQSSGDYAFDFIYGGDGMQVEVDTRTNDLVYTGSQFGFYGRVNTHTGERKSIRPRHELGERPLRFNWQTPIHLSRYNQDILYFGANRLYRSMNRGDDWTAISPDLTRGGRPGDVPFGTLTTIEESPLRFGLLYTGSDDGLIHVSKDAGTTWTRISDGLPDRLWVSRVAASHHAEGRVYAAYNGYRSDHFDAYVYRSDDYGQTWTRIGTDLPPEPVNVVTEDPVNEDVLFVGTDHGLYVSLDRGQSFMAMVAGLPAAPVHDVKVQAREKDLVVGTHGRSIYIADLEQVEQMTPELLAEALHLFSLDDVRHSPRWGSRSAAWQDYTVPETTFPYYSAAAGTVTIRVKGTEDLVLKEWTAAAERGLNFTSYDLSATPAAADAFNEGQKDAENKMKAADNGIFYLLPGTYTIEIARDGTTVSGTLKVTEPRGRR